MLKIKFSAYVIEYFFVNFSVFFTTSPTWIRTSQWIRIILVRLVSTWVLNKPLKFRRNSLNRFWGIVVTSLKNTVWRKTRLKLQIGLPPIKFCLSANLLSLVHKVNLQLPQKSPAKQFVVKKKFDFLNQLHGMWPL